MSEANKQLARRWFEEVWNQKNETAVDAMYAPQAQCHGFPDADSVLVGPEAFKAVHRNFIGSFPDLHASLEDIITEGDHVAIRWRVTMTHTGDTLGFPASGRQVAMNGSSFITVKDGRIQEGWNYMDIQHLFAQLQ